MPHLPPRAALLAIAALDKVAGDLHDAPLRDTLAVRAILALLHAASNGDREPYDAFWKACHDDPGSSETVAGVGRTALARPAIYSIARTLGLEWANRATSDAVSEIQAQERKRVGKYDRERNRAANRS